jgi:hypothetical protein
MIVLILDVFNLPIVITVLCNVDFVLTVVLFPFNNFSNGN